MKNNIENQTKKSKFSVRALTICFAILSVLAIAITGVVAGVSSVFSINSNAGVNIYEEEIDYSVYANAPLTFANPSSESLVIIASSIYGSDSDDTNITIKNGSGTECYYEGNTLTANIKDVRTEVGNYKYLTSNIDTITIHYQLGAGTYGSSNTPCVFVAKYVINLNMINNGDIAYNCGSCTVSYLALEVANNAESKPENLYNPIATPLAVFKQPTEISSFLATGISDFWDRVGEYLSPDKITYKPYGDVCGSGFSMSFVNNDVVVDKNNTNTTYCGASVVASGLKSNIWIKADFSTVTHSETINSYIINDDVVLSDKDSDNLVSDNIADSASDNTDYKLSEAGSITNTVKNSENLLNNKTTTSSTSSISNNDLSSVDINKTTITPYAGYYISDVILNYNGVDYRLLQCDAPSINSDRKVVYNIKNKIDNGLLSSTNTNGDLNFYYQNDSFDQDKGSFEFTYAGFMKDVEINVVFKSCTFILLEVDENYTDNTKPIANNANGITGNNFASNKSAFLDLFVSNLRLKNQNYDISDDRISLAKIGNVSYLVLRIPGAKDVDIVMQNENNNTASIDSFNTHTSSRLYRRDTIDETISYSVASGDVCLSSNRDAFSFNPLHASGSYRPFVVMRINSTNDRTLDYQAYIGTDHMNTYREDKDLNDDLYLYNHASGSNGVWSDVTVEYYNAFNADSTSTYTAYTSQAQNGSKSHNFYGNFLKVTMKNINGYNNRKVVLNFGGYTVDFSDDPSEVTPDFVSKDVTAGHVLDYKVTKDGDNFVVEFKLDNLTFNDFELKTYYTPYEYEIKFTDNLNNSEDTRDNNRVFHTIVAYQNVKPELVYEELFATSAISRNGYTLMGYTENTRFESLRSVASNLNPVMYYQSSNGTHLMKAENGALEAIRNENPENDELYLNYYKMANENPDTYLTDGYGWDWYPAVASGFYRLAKNLNQLTIGATATANAVINMYAIWHANNYNVCYDATSYGSTEIFIDYDNDGTFEHSYNTTDASGNPITGVDTIIRDDGGHVYETDVSDDHRFRTDFASGENREFASGTTSFKMPTLDRLGYIFIGWSYVNFAIVYEDSNLDYDAAYPVDMNGNRLNVTSWEDLIVNEDTVFDYNIINSATTASNVDYTPSSVITYDHGNVAGAGDLKLYAIWRAIVYTITTDSYQSVINLAENDFASEGDNRYQKAKEHYDANLGLYDTYAEYKNVFGSYATEIASPLNFDLNDYWCNNNATISYGSSPAKIYNNNQYRVQFDGKFTNLFGSDNVADMYPTRVGYDFKAWCYTFVDGTDMVDDDGYKFVTKNTTLDNNFLLSTYRRTLGVESGFSDGDKLGRNDDAWIQLVPSWEAQKFNVYYSLANHTLRGYEYNRVVGYDDVTFKINGIDMNYEGTRDGITYLTQEVTFDQPFELYGFESNNYLLDGWYYYYDNESEPLTNAPFATNILTPVMIDTDDDSILDKIVDNLLGDTFVSGTGIYSNNTIVKTGDAYSDTFNFSRYLFNARWADYHGVNNGYDGIRPTYQLNVNVWDVDSFNTINEQNYYESLIARNRKFTVFSDLSPKDLTIEINNPNSTDNEHNVIYGDASEDSLYKEGTNVGGHVELYYRDYIYTTGNDPVISYSDYIYTGNSVFDATESFNYNAQSNSVESDYLFAFVPMKGRYLESVTFTYGYNGSVTFNFVWVPKTKTLQIAGVTINKNTGAGVKKVTGQNRFAWDDVIANLYENGAYQVQSYTGANGTGDVLFGETQDIFGDFEWRNEYELESGDKVSDINPVYMELIFPKHINGENIVVTPTWRLQTFDVEIYTLKASDTNNPSYEDVKTDAENGNPDIITDLGYLKLSGVSNPILSKAYKLTIPYGFELHATYDITKTDYDDRYTKFNAMVWDDDTNAYFEPTHFDESTNSYSKVAGVPSIGVPIWEKQYYSGYRFLDYFEFFSGYTQLDFIYESGTDRNEIFIPTGELNVSYKFLGGYDDNKKMTYFNGLDGENVNSRYLLDTNSRGSVQGRNMNDRYQTIYDNYNLFNVYVRTSRHEVVFHLFNPETNKYEVLNTGDDYLLSTWDTNGDGKIDSNDSTDHPRKLTSDLVDGVHGFIKSTPSFNNQKWPVGAILNGYVVGPNLKQLYGYTPNADGSDGGEYLYNTDYVGKFFTKTFVDLASHEFEDPDTGRTILYDDGSMYDVYELFDTFDKNYMIDHEIHVYAVYDFKQFNVDNTGPVDLTDSEYPDDWVEHNSGVFTVGNNGNVEIEVSDSTKLLTNGNKIRVNINLAWVDADQDSSPRHVFSEGDVEYIILDEAMYSTYLKTLEKNNNKETSLRVAKNVPIAYSYSGNYRYIFFYLKNYDYTADNMIYYVCDNIIKVEDVNTSDSAFTTDIDKITVQSSGGVIRFKTFSYDNVNSTYSYSLDLGAYSSETDKVLHASTDATEVWLKANEFNNFIKYRLNDRYPIIEALNRSNGSLPSVNEVRGADDEYLFLILHRGGNVVLATTNFVRIDADGNFDIFETTEYFDVIDYNRNAIDESAYERNLDVNFEISDTVNPSNTTHVSRLNFNFNIAYTYFDYDAQDYVLFDYKNVGFVMLDEIGFANYQKLIDEGKLPEEAILEAQNDDTNGNEVYIIACLTDKSNEAGSVDMSTVSRVYLVCDTIFKYTSNSIFEIENNGFRIIATRITDKNNPKYYFNGTEADLNSYDHDYNGEPIVENDGSYRVNNNILSYHLNCTPEGAGGYVILSEKMYQNYLAKLNTGTTIEEALSTICGNLESGKFYKEINEFTSDDEEVNSIKYIFAYRQIGSGTGLYIVSSSIVVYNPARDLVSIKPAYNYFDISACFAKNEGDWVKPSAYDVKISTVDLGIGISKNYDIYFTLNLAQHKNASECYTKEDIKYVALSEDQYNIYINERNANKSIYEALNEALSISSDFAEKSNIYIFAYLGETVTGNNFTSSHVFASHVINLNYSLDYAILI